MFLFLQDQRGTNCLVPKMSKKTVRINPKYLGVKKNETVDNYKAKLKRKKNEDSFSI